jgi:hypothetical protein
MASILATCVLPQEPVPVPLYHADASGPLQQNDPASCALLYELSTMACEKTEFR